MCWCLSVPPPYIPSPYCSHAKIWNKVIQFLLSNQVGGGWIAGYRRLRNNLSFCFITSIELEMYRDFRLIFWKVLFSSTCIEEHCKNLIRSEKSADKLNFSTRHEWTIAQPNYFCMQCCKHGLEPGWSSF